MKLKNLAKIFSRDKETARDSNTVNHNLVPNSTPVNINLIGAEIGEGLQIANGVLNSKVLSSDITLNTESLDFTRWVCTPSTFENHPIVIENYDGAWRCTVPGTTIAQSASKGDALSTSITWDKDFDWLITVTAVRPPKSYRLGTQNGLNADKLLQPAGDYQPKGNYADNQTVTTILGNYLAVADVDNSIYYTTLQDGSVINMAIPSLDSKRVLSFEIIVNSEISTSFNFTATVGGDSESIVWLDTPDMAQGAGKYFFVFRYMPSVGLLGNLYWFKSAA